MSISNIRKFFFLPTKKLLHNKLMMPQKGGEKDMEQRTSKQK